MTDWETGWGVSLVGSALLYVVLAVVAGVFSIASEFLAAVFLIAILVLGPVVVAGGVVGVGLVGLLNGALGPWTVVTAAEFAVLTGGVSLLWGRVGLVASDTPPTMRSSREVGEYLLALAIAAVTTLAVVGWLVALLATQPYYTGYPELLAVVLVAAVLVPPACYWLGRESVVGASSPDPEPERRGGLRVAAALFVVSTGWFVLGTGVATMAHDLSRFPDDVALSASFANTFGTGTLGQLAFEAILMLYRFGDLVVGGIGLVALAVLTWLWPVTWRRVLTPEVAG